VTRDERTRRVNKAVGRWLSDQSHCIHAKELGIETAISKKIAAKGRVGSTYAISENIKIHLDERCMFSSLFSRRVDYIGWKHRPEFERFIIIEVKSCAQDYRSDSKWKLYLGFCHLFYFAVDEDFPTEIIDRSTGAGVLVAPRQGEESPNYKCRILHRAKIRPGLGAGVDRERLIYLIARRLFYLNVGLRDEIYLLEDTRCRARHCLQRRA